MMRTVIDFHSHILPGIDDGSRNVLESIQMLQIEAEQGISKVVLTPHFYAHCDNLEEFLKRRSYSEKMLRDEMKHHPGLPEITLGAEVYFFSGISNCSELKDLSIGSGKYVLIEMPQSPWTDDQFRELERIYTKQGLIPIIAHIDRYISRFRTFGIPQRLMQLAVLIQANADFFLEKKTTAMAMRMLRNGNIHLLGSDCHSLHSRKPNLGDAIVLIENRLGSEYITKIAEYGQKVLSGTEIHIPHTHV